MWYHYLGLVLLTWLDKCMFVAGLVVFFFFWFDLLVEVFWTIDY